MRILAIILAILPTTTLADVFQVAPTPSQVLVHPEVARVVREATVEMPQGRHEIRMSDLPMMMREEFVDILIDGATIETRSIRSTPRLTEERLAGSAALRDARATLERAEQALAAHNDRVASLRNTIDAALAQITFLEGLGQLEGLTGDQLDAAQLRSLAQTIAEDGAAARQTIQDANTEIRALELARKPLIDALALAQDALTRIQIPYEAAKELSLTVNVTSAGPVSLSVSYYVENVGWTPTYRLLLDETAGTLAIERDVTISQGSGEPWDAVSLSVTTLPITGQSNPSILYPQKLQIMDAPSIEPRAAAPRKLSSQDFSGDLAAESITIAEEQGSASFSGAGVTYDFASPVSIDTADSATVALEPLEISAEVIARAVPSRDQTAFRILRFANATGERILSGEAVMFVDGNAVGSTWLENIEAGADEELGFGPIFGLQLRRAVLDREEGDRGVITRENQTQEIVRIVVENVSDRDWDVTLVDNVPYSEQEDLEIIWDAQPSPSRENVDDKRGILEWDMTLEAGATKEVRLGTDIRWPNGQILR